MNFQQSKQLEIIITIPQLNYTQNICSISNNNKESWFRIVFLKEGQSIQLKINNDTFLLPQLQRKTESYYGSFMTWQNITFSLKAYRGKQEFIKFDDFFIFNNEFFGLLQQVVHNHKNQIEIAMYIRQKENKTSSIFGFRDALQQYVLAYYNSTLLIKFSSDIQLEYKQFAEMQQNEWIRFHLYFQYNKIITQFNTIKKQQELVFINQIYTENNVINFGLQMQFNPAFTQIDNIKITDRMNQNKSDHCFPGCKRCLDIQCLECEPNLNLTNNCSCEENSFYNKQLQVCQDISQYNGIKQNTQQVIICQLNEYFNIFYQKCLKCPKIEEYYCTDCVYNTNLWKLNQTCTFQEINTNLFLKQISSSFGVKRNTFLIKFNWNLSEVLDNSCALLQEEGQLICENTELDNLNIKLCQEGHFDFTLQKCKIEKGYFNKFYSSIMCKLGYTLIQTKCLKCQPNCVICQYQQKYIQCIIAKEGYFVQQNKNLIKLCNNDITCQNIQSDVLKYPQEHCLLKFKQNCLFCEQFHILDSYSNCRSGESISVYLNFEFFANQFEQLSFQQLAQLSNNQDLELRNQTFQQIYFYGKQYKNIKTFNEAIQSNDSHCNQYIYFDKSKQCVSYKLHYKQIVDNQYFNYCPDDKCSYNLTINVDIYYSNIQIVIYENKTFYSIQQLLTNMIVNLNFQEIQIIAQVYVFDSFKQQCLNSEVFMLNEEVINLLYANTFFKLILIFETQVQFSDCEVQNFYSNFNYIEIRNLMTQNQLIIQANTKSVTFMDCIFFDNQKIILVSQYILFQNVSFIDAIINNTLIDISSYGDFIQQMLFISCNFFRLTVKDHFVININSFVDKILIQNLVASEVYLMNSIFIQFYILNELQAQTIQFHKLRSIQAMIFMGSKLQFNGQISNFSNIIIIDSAFLESIFYEFYCEAEIKNVSISACQFQDSNIFNFVNEVNLNNFVVRDVLFSKSTLILKINQKANAKLKAIRIIDSVFNQSQQNNSIVSIKALKINLEQIIIANSSYQPPIKIYDIKATFGRISQISLLNFTPNYHFLVFEPFFIFNFNIENLIAQQIQFEWIIIKYVRLLCIKSDIVTVFDLKVLNIKLQSSTINDLIRFDLVDEFSIFKLEGLTVSLLLVNWIDLSWLISILGSHGGNQYINAVLIQNVLSYSSYYIFNCQSNNLQISHIYAEFDAHVGFVVQYASNILVQNYTQYNPMVTLPWETSIFQNWYHTSVYEILSISNSSFRLIKQPIVKLQHCRMAKINIKNVQILNYQGYQDLFNLSYQIYSQFTKNNALLLVNIDQLYVRNSSKNKQSLISCSFNDIRLNHIYFFNVNFTILDQSEGKSIIIKNVKIRNSQLRQISQFFIADILNFIVIENIFIKNQNGLFNIFNINKVSNCNLKILIQNIYLDNCNNCSSLITLYQQVNLTQFYIQNFVVISSNFQQNLINLYFQQGSKGQIQNLLAKDCILQQLVNNQQKELTSYLNQLQLINLQFLQPVISKGLIYTYTQVSNCSFYGRQIAIVNKQLVINYNQKILQHPIAITFNKNYFFNTIQIQEMLFEVLFDNNSKLAYAPSGSTFSNFKYQDPTTKQQIKPYEDFIIILNQSSHEYIFCNLNQSIDSQLGNFSNINQFYLKNGINIISNFTFLLNPYLNYTYLQNDITCSNLTLRFNIRTLPCSLGEYLYQNACLTCDITKNYYSVIRRAQLCDIIDIQKIEKLQIGKIMLRSGFWRAKHDSNKIEACNNEQCLGGWAPGDGSCQTGYVGALCKECDIYNLRGQGKYALQNEGCVLCDINYQIILRGVLVSFWLMFLGYMSYNTNQQITQKYLVFKITQRNLADILMRQSTNQVSIILKIFTNYIFYLYLLKGELDFINYKFNISLDFISNPNLLVKPQLDFILVEYHQVGIHYVQLIFSMISPFYTLTLLYSIFLILFKLKVIQFQFNLIVITIYSVYLFNQQLIFQNQIQLLSYSTASNIEWINLNQQFQFNTRQHHHIIYIYIIPSTILLLLLPLLIFVFLRNMNKTSIKSTKYFGILFTEYKRDYYYWEIVRIYQKYIIIGLIFYFNKKFILFIIHYYQAFISLTQPYPLKNLNDLEQKSFFTLISSLLIILLIADSSKIVKESFFLIVNLFLIYALISNVILKIKLQNKTLIMKLQMLLIQKFPFAVRMFNIQTSVRLKYNMDLLRNSYTKLRSGKQMKIDQDKIQLQTNFQRFETEIEMMDIKK